MSSTPDASSDFPIATIPVPGGGRIGICALPGGTGDLEGDLGAVHAWQPAVVVSMTEQAEMEAAGAGDLGRRLRRAGIDWHHLPIRDFGAPDEAVRSAWPALSIVLQGALDRGVGVLVHCRGGRGRSGMIALRLMVERGAVPEVALGELRAARPGAVETEGQFDWATAPRGRQG